MKFILVIFVVLACVVSAGSTTLNLNPAANALRPSVAIDRQGRIVVAWVELQNGVSRAFVRRWDGRQWGNMGGYLNVNPRFPASYVSLALNQSGNPVVAFTEKNTEERGKVYGSGKLYIKRFDGRNWIQMGASPSKSENTVSDVPILRLDSKDYPVVCWSEIPPDFNVDHFYVSRWNGTRWVTVDRGSLTSDISSSSRSRSMIVNRRDEPILAFSNQLFFNGYSNFQLYVGRWSGRFWRPLGVQGEPKPGEGSLNQSPQNWAGSAGLALDSNDNPVVAYNETDTGFDVFVQRWTGKAWEPYSPTVNDGTGLGYRPQVKLNALDNPIVAWIENAGALQIRVARWDGAAWEPMGTLNQNPKADADSFSLALDAQGNPVVAWSEMVGTNHRIFISRWDGQKWVGLEAKP